MAGEVLIITAIGEPGSEERKTADKHLEIFEEAARLAGMVAVRIDNVDCESITPALWEKLRTSRVVIADLSWPNPNAAYELGVRHGLQMPVLITTNRIETLPFDFKDYNAHLLCYDGTDAPRLARRLRRPAREIENTVFKDWRFRVIPPPQSDVNVHFYDTLVEALRESKQGAIVAGSGFEDNSWVMNEYVRVLAGCSMVRSFTRIDISTPEDNPKWWLLVAKYLLPIPGFRLFVPSEDVNMLVDIGLVDWLDPQLALVGIMFHTDVRLGDWPKLEDLRVRRAGYSLFAYSQQLAEDLFSILRDLRERRLLFEIKSLDQLRDHFDLPETWAEEERDGKVESYFAYGSSMVHEHMRSRAASAKAISTAFLHEYSLSSTLGTASFSSPVANIVPSEGSMSLCYGVLYEIDAAELSRLDFFKAVEEGEFSRERVDIIRSDTKEKVRAWVHLASESDIQHVVSDVYLENMIVGARNNMIPEDYIRASIMGLNP